jgi:DNA primase
MEIIDQIRQTANILDIASQYTTLKKSGRRHVGLCPFHSEKTPSFTLDEEKQLFHCFGCGAGGDIFTLVMEKENLSFAEALRYLAQKYNITLPERKRLSPQYKKLEENILKLTEMALAFFKKNLFNTSEGRKALEYLKKRQISDEIIQKFKIGYALNSWDSLISFFERQNISPELLEKAGLAIFNPKKNSYYDRFRGRIIFPIFSESGKTVAFGGRSLFDAEPKYLNSPDTPIYTKGKLLYGLNFSKESIREEGEIILVEGYTDYIALYQAGITNLAASLGTSLTPDQISLAKRFTKKMIMSFDGDTAGLKAASRAVSLGFEKGMQTTCIQIPKEFDPDSYLKKHGAEAFRSLIKNSLSGLHFLIRTQTRGVKLESPEEKSKTIRGIVGEISKIPDPVVRNEYLKQISEHFAVEESVLRSIATRKNDEKIEQEKDVFLHAEKSLLQMVFENSTLASNVLGSIKEENFRGLKSEPIFRFVLESYAQYKKIPNINEIKEKIDRALFGSLSKVLMEEGNRPTEKDARDCLDTLKILSLEKQGKQIDIKISQLEKLGEKQEVSILLNKKYEITKQLSLLAQRNQ